MAEATGTSPEMVADQMNASYRAAQTWLAEVEREARELLVLMLDEEPTEEELRAFTMRLAVIRSGG